ncbi:translation initiation factor 4B [Apiospora marii]|uniref:translation initiation factor 4B n=1 Tax=Apiospora marii TaxID=335849 RepID=UPI0031314B0A
MAPKKKEQKTMSLGAFLNEDKYGGSWADEVEDSFGSQPLPAPARAGYSGYGSTSSYADRGFSVRERDSYPTELPTKPPYTAHLGNLSYEATNETVSEFFEGCDLSSVRIIEDRELMRPKGFAYAEFKDVEGLKKALTLDGESFQGRNIRIKIADPPKNSDRMGGGGEARDLSSWERKGPLADAPGRTNERRNDFGEAPGSGGGPLSPLPQAERSESRGSSRARAPDANRTDSFNKERRASPATWGEGRAAEGSRPPRREFSERPERPDRPERTPTAAELDNQWRTHMKPDHKSPEQSQHGSEAPSSPAGPAAAPAPVGRPKLNLAKRTVSEAPGVTSPPLGSATDPKANPFGAARPIDTAAKEREIAEKKEQAAKEKKEADEKAKEDRRLAKEAAAKESAEKAAAAEAEKEAAPAAAEKTEAEATETTEQPKEAQNGTAGEQVAPARPREQAPAPKARGTEGGSWRSAPGEARGGRGGAYQNAPRGRGETRGRGGRGRGGYGEAREPREPREPRGPRSNGGSQSGQQSVPATPITEDAPAAPQDPEGWTTVPAKGRRGPTRV